MLKGAIDLVLWSDFEGDSQGFIQDFSTGGGGQHQCHCAATHVTRGGRGGELC